MAQAILVINAGSTSLKFGAYKIGVGGIPDRLCRGGIDNMENGPTFSVDDHNGINIGNYTWHKEKTIAHEEALTFLISWLEKNISDLKVVGAGHRIVLGGTRYSSSVFIEEETLNYLDSLSMMEPSHQPFNVACARAFAKTFPHLQQVACFDTSFHRTMPKVAQIYAVPKEILDHGVHHYGYHGISYDYISRQIKKLIPSAKRVIIAHLGGGGSMCALLDGKSIDTSMGFSGLSGLPMATRTGDLPPEIIFYLLRSQKYDAHVLEKMLYKQSGLLGISGITSDMKALLLEKSQAAKDAIHYFAYQVVKYTGAYTAILGGLDAFVFTAGIGENAIPFRKIICDQLNFLGIELDESMNQKKGPTPISSINSKVAVWVIPTNEELMIAIHTLSLLRSKGLKMTSA